MSPRDGAAAPDALAKPMGEEMTFARAVALAALLTLCACRERARSQGAPAPGSVARPASCDAAAAAEVGGPCAPTILEFDPDRVYQVLGWEVRDVEAPEKVTFGLVASYRAWIVRSELYYVRNGPIRFRADPMKRGSRGCERVEACEIPDPPYDEGEDPCGPGKTRQVFEAPDGGTVRECVTPPGRLRALWGELRDGMPPPPTWSVILVDGRRVELDPGEGLVRPGRTGRVLTHSAGAVYVLDGEGRGVGAPVRWNTSTPVRATDEGFLIVDAASGAPVAWKVDRAGGTQLPPYPALKGLMWSYDFALDRRGRLFGTANEIGGSRCKILRAVPGEAEVTELGDHHSSECPRLVTGL